MYWNIEQRCQKYLTWITTFIAICQLQFISTLLSSFYSISVGNSDTSTWSVVYYCFVPFNTDILCNWYLLWVYQITVSILYAMVISSTTAHFLCHCLYMHGICDHFDMLISSVEKNVKDNQSEMNPIVIQNGYRKIKQTFFGAIGLHINLHE